MTENEAIKILQGAIKKPNTKDGYLGQAVTMAIQALEENQRYHAYKETFENNFSKEELKILSDKVEFEKWIERGKWIAKRCDEINRELQALKKQNTDCILKHLTGYCSYNETGCSDCKGKIAIKTALEKAEPKKIIDKNENEYTVDFICPSCNEPVIGQLYRPNYCKHCGCKLDWS